MSLNNTTGSGGFLPQQDQGPSFSTLLEQTQGVIHFNHHKKKPVASLDTAWSGPYGTKEI